MIDQQDQTRSLLFSLNFLIPIVITLLTIAAWWLLNQPTEEPPWPTRIQGFAFSPIRPGQDPSKQRFPSLKQIDADLALVARDAYAIRTYTVENNLAAIPRLAAAHDVNVTLGAWIGADRTANERELTRLNEILAAGYHNLVRVMVGNESLLRKDIELTELIRYLDQVKKNTWLPVSTAEPWHIWLRYPKLVEHVDFITVHLLPYWEGIPLEQSIDYVIHRYNQLKETYPNKQLIIGEVGWPSNGRRNRGAEASLLNQTRFLRRFLARAENEHYIYYVMEAFDQPWKARTEGATGTYWGVYDAQRTPKFAFTELVVRIPQWRELAALSILLAIFLLILLYRDSATLAQRGKGFLALITYGSATAVVWIIYDYTQQYLTPATIIVGLILLFGGFGVLILLLAEAHEWAEALWLRRKRRAFPIQYLNQKKSNLPFISIHVPAYNEPPVLLFETLNSLVNLKYPNFEVLIIDNNTKDPQTWQPVSEYCKQLGTRFRFFHIDSLAGYKAGALNFALRETIAQAEIIAVIDADYIVRSNWLYDLIAAFNDSRVAIVQAPQDYRDAHQNAFKALCMAEYRGFFRLGMIIRNERNAIIQHGTMTMIRRTALESVGGWAEWCITEDAELGLRLFEAGYSALYLPCTYGQGLMPDTFADFRKQRYRWAYGAVKILLQHWRELTGLKPTKLSIGQRYHFIAGWLPWFADGFNLLFNLAALAWSVAMVLMPLKITPPYMTIALIPLVLFTFKLIKSFFLYRIKVTATWRQSIAAGLAGLALSNTIARAVISGLITNTFHFFRTPKLTQAPIIINALKDAREELLLVCAFWFAASLILQRYDAEMLDLQVWVAVLIVQSIPPFAAVLVSLISACPKLSAHLIGPLPPMNCSENFNQQ